MTENTNVNAEVAEAKAEQELTVTYIMEQIEKIRADDKHITDALERLYDIEPSKGPGDMSPGQKAENIADVVRCRETTNQKLIGFYEKVYDDLTHKRSDAHEKVNAAKEVLFSYLDHIADPTMDDDEVHEARMYVQSQIDLLIQEIMVGNN